MHDNLHWFNQFCPVLSFEMDPPPPPLSCLSLLLLSNQSQKVVEISLCGVHYC